MVSLKNIKAGEIFLFENNLYMKTNDTKKIEGENITLRTCVNLGTGSLMYIPHNAAVLNANAVIKFKQFPEYRSGKGA